VLRRSPFKFFIVVIAALFLSACGSGNDDPEALLRETINAIQQSAESRDLSGMMGHVSEDYLDSDGRDIRQVKAIVQFQLLRNPKIHTFKVVKSLNLLSDSEAEVFLLVAVAGVPIDGVTSLSKVRADLMRFDLRFQYDESWKLMGAQWRPAESADFL